MKWTDKIKLVLEGLVHQCDRLTVANISRYRDAMRLTTVDLAFEKIKTMYRNLDTSSQKIKQ